MEAQAFLDFEEGEEQQQLTESSSDQEQEGDAEQDIDWAKLEDSAPSAEDYSSQSDDDTEANDYFMYISRWVAVVTNTNLL